MSGNESAAVLASRPPLHPGFEKIAAMSGEREGEAEERRLPEAPPQQLDAESNCPRRENCARDESRPCLVRRECRNELRSTEQAAQDERTRIRCPHCYEEHEHCCGALRHVDTKGNKR